MAQAAVSSVAKNQRDMDIRDDDTIQYSTLQMKVRAARGLIRSLDFFVAIAEEGSKVVYEDGSIRFECGGIAYIVLT